MFIMHTYKKCTQKTNVYKYKYKWELVERGLQFSRGANKCQNAMWNRWALKLLLLNAQ